MATTNANKTPLIIAGAVLLVIVGGALAYTLTKDKDSNSNESTHREDPSSISLADGSLQAETGIDRLPNGFPEAAVSVYPGTIVSSNRIGAEGDPMVSWSVIVETSDSVASVSEKIKSAYSDGWTTGSGFEESNSIFLSFFNPDYNVSISIDPSSSDPSKTSVRYAVSNEGISE